MEGGTAIPMQLGPGKVLEQVGRRISPSWGGCGLELLWDICLPPEESLTGRRRQTDEREANPGRSGGDPLKLRVQQHLKQTDNPFST